MVVVPEGVRGPSDSQIRAAVRAALELSSPRDLIVDEMPLADRRAFMDVAVIGATLRGFEIKSDRDGLGRLARQAQWYGRSFDEVTLVAARRHLSAAATIAPAWWGLTAADAGADGAAVLTPLRAPRENPFVDPLQLLNLLSAWELRRVLRENELSAGSSRFDKYAMMHLLLERFPTSAIHRAVMLTLRYRSTWTSRTLGTGEREAEVWLSAQPEPDVRRDVCSMWCENATFNAVVELPAFRAPVAMSSNSASP